MNSTALLFAPLAVAALGAASTVGGAIFARRFRHQTNYTPLVPIALLSGSAVASIAFLALWAPAGVVVAAFLLWVCGLAGCGSYIRSRWAQDFGVGEIGAMQREREGVRDFVRDRQEPGWRDESVQETRDRLLTDDGRCLLGPEVRRSDLETSTGRTVSVKLGKMTPGPGGNSGVVGLLLGRPESGKTTTAIRLLHATAEADPGGRIIIVDPKGDAGLRQAGIDIARKHGTTFWEWSEDHRIDPLANPLADPKRATQAAVARVMAAMDFTEEHYKGIALNAYTDAAYLLELVGLPLSLASMSQVLNQREAKEIMQDAAVRARRGELDPAAATEFAEWHKGQGKADWEGMAGAASRLMMLDRSGLGAQFAPASEGARTISDLATIPGVSYLYLDAGMWPDAAQQVAELLTVALMQDVGRIALTSENTITMFIDEVNAIPAKRMDAILMRGRSAGFSIYMASQTLGAIGAVTPELFSQITGTLSWCIAHSSIGQSMVGEDDAERIGRLGGTRIERELTTQTSGGMLAMPTGAGSQRQVDAYHAHPNLIRSLKRGRAIVIDVDESTAAGTRSMLTWVTRLEQGGRTERPGLPAAAGQRLLPAGPDLVPEIPYPQRGWQNSPMRPRRRGLYR